VAFEHSPNSAPGDLVIVSNENAKHYFLRVLKRKWPICPTVFTIFADAKTMPNSYPPSYKRLRRRCSPRLV
jgi:hypothetical protein